MRKPRPRPRDENGKLIPKKKGPTIIEYKIKSEDKIDTAKPGTTFRMPSGAQFRMLASGSLIRADRNKKLNKKERRINRMVVKARTEELRAKVEAYENELCICNHRRVTHKEDTGSCLGCTCSRFVGKGADNREPRVEVPDSSVGATDQTA